MFKTEVGIPLKEYITQRKMESARLLLTTTSLPVSVIASKLGYDNFSYFSQVYRRCTGSLSQRRAEKEVTCRLRAKKRPWLLRKVKAFSFVFFSRASFKSVWR